MSNRTKDSSLKEDEIYDTLYVITKTIKHGNKTSFIYFE